jgi:hypothetical protein
MEKKWNNMRECIADKVVHLFGLCRLKGKRFGKLALLCGWDNHESLVGSCFVC